MDKATEFYSDVAARQDFFLMCVLSFCVVLFVAFVFLTVLSGRIVGRMVERLVFSAVISVFISTAISLVSYAILPSEVIDSQPQVQQAMNHEHAFYAVTQQSIDEALKKHGYYVDDVDKLTEDSGVVRVSDTKHSTFVVGRLDDDGEPMEIDDKPRCTVKPQREAVRADFWNGPQLVFTMDCRTKSDADHNSFVVDKDDFSLGQEKWTAKNHIANATRSLSFASSK